MALFGFLKGKEKIASAKPERLFDFEPKDFAPKRRAAGLPREAFGLQFGVIEASAPLKKSDVSITFTGVLVHTHICQHFCHDGKSAIEATYSFPLPTHGILLGMTVKIGNATLHSVVQPKKEASDIYEKAVAGGNSAFLLKKLSGNTHQMNLGNIKPGEEVVVSVRYAEVLEWTANTLRYRLPTVIAPHYGDPAKSRIDEIDAPSTNMLAEYPMTLGIEFSTGFAEADISSPTHALTVTKSPGKVAAKIGEKAYLDRDFILEVRMERPAPWAAWSAKDGDKFAFLATLCPPPLTSKSAPAGALETTVVLDCSGSMAGDSIQQAKKALHKIISIIPNGSRFQVVCFGSTATAWFRQPTEITDSTRRKLLAKVGEVDANLGGTELQNAIETAFKVSSPNAEILLLTDGEVHVSEDEFQRYAKGTHRFFTVGIGSAVSENVVWTLAERTGGAMELVTPNENMADRIVAHFLRMNSPRGCAKVTIDEQAATLGASRDVVFPGDTIIFAGSNPLPGEKSTARLDFGATAMTFESTINPAENELALILPRIAAWFRIQKLASEKEAIETAINYQLLTDHTSMVAVYERAIEDRVEEMPEFVESPQMLPAGWGGVGSVSRASYSTPRVADTFDDDLESLDLCASRARDEQDPIDAAAEEAAIAYANGDLRNCELVLKDSIHAFMGLAGEEVLWLMLFDLFKLTDRTDSFYQLGQEYALRFQKDPPQWTYASADIFDEGVFYLSGQQSGGGKIDGLDSYLSNRANVVIDMNAVNRIDFSYAGVLLATLRPFCLRGVDIELRHPNHLVAALLKVVGLADVATIRQLRL